jgi:hypothetical protein
MIEIRLIIFKPTLLISDSKSLVLVREVSWPCFELDSSTIFRVLSLRNVCALGQLTYLVDFLRSRGYGA